LTPRFAVTSTVAQLDAAGALKREFPDVHVQSHVSENVAEIALVASMFPEASSYLDVYARHGLTGPRTIYGHGVHLSESDFAFLHESGTALAHCPTSNNFLGSGLFRIGEAKRADRAGARGARDGPGRRHQLLDPAHDAGGRTRSRSSPARRCRRLPRCTWPRAGAAHALDIDDRVGSVAPGMEADLVVLDLASTPVIELRMRTRRTSTRRSRSRWRSATTARCARPTSPDARVTIAIAKGVRRALR
jgi:guanine deaminase